MHHAFANLFFKMPMMICSDNSGRPDVVNLAELLQSAKRIHDRAKGLVLYQGTADVAADGPGNQSQKPSDYWARHRNPPYVN